MRIPALTSATLSFAAMMAIASACLPEHPPLAASPAMGHEETKLPAATPAPKPAEPPQQQAARPKVAPPLPGCRSIEERLASIVKAAPDAAVYRRFGPALADDYARSFNAVHGTRISADEVAIVVSSLWGDRAIILFERNGCETGTEQDSLATQG